MKIMKRNPWRTNNTDFFSFLEVNRDVYVYMCKRTTELSKY